MDFKVGASIYDALRGYTTRADQEEVINKSQMININNIGEFFKQYNNEKGIGADGFFSQLHSEYGFDEQQQILLNTAVKLQYKLQFEGKLDLAKKIENITQDGIVDKNEAKQLDQITDTMNDYKNCNNYSNGNINLNGNNYYNSNLYNGSLFNLNGSLFNLNGINCNNNIINPINFN